MVVHFAHFQVQARERGGLGWFWGCFLCLYLPVRPGKGVLERGPKSLAFVFAIITFDCLLE